MIVGHRGASKAAPENTIPAFELAWEAGADAIECDIRLTRDGEIVCVHDGNTARVADGDLVVVDATLAELRKLDFGATHGDPYRGTVVPTMADVLATIPAGRRIYIEIKCGPEIIPELLSEIRRSGLGSDQIVVIAFSRDVIRELKAQAPELRAFWLVHFQADADGALTPSLETVLATLAEIKADGLDAGKDLVDEAFVRSIMAHGYEFHVWTVDDPETAARFLKWGASSITTNVPGVMV